MVYILRFKTIVLPIKVEHNFALSDQHELDGHVEVRHKHVASAAVCLPGLGEFTVSLC